jgi:hypothetical protein
VDALRTDVGADVAASGRQVAIDQARRECPGAVTKLEHRIRMLEVGVSEQLDNRPMLVDSLEVLDTADPVVETARLLRGEVPVCRPYTMSASRRIRGVVRSIGSVSGRAPLHGPRLRLFVGVASKWRSQTSWRLGITPIGSAFGAALAVALRSRLAGCRGADGKGRGKHSRARSTMIWGG